MILTINESFIIHFAFECRIKILKDLRGKLFVFEIERNHNTFASSNLLGYPTGGSTSIYNEDEDGNGIYNFEIIDKIYDNSIENNCIPIVELSFMSLDLVLNSKDLSFNWEVDREFYERNNRWKLPRKEYKKWQQLIEKFIDHLYQWYGEQVQNWYFEVWNEPNLTI